MNKKALLVAVTDATDSTYALAGAGETIDLLQDVLVQAGGFVCERLDTKALATGAMILDKVEKWLLAGSAKDDVLVLVISSHGERASRQGGAPEDSFLPSNYDPKKPRERVWNSDLEKLFQAGLDPGANLYCIYDFCRSGDGLLRAWRLWIKSRWLEFLPFYFATRHPPPASMVNKVVVSNPKNWIVLSSCQPGLPSTYDLGGAGAGWFSQGLAEAAAAAPSTGDAALGALTWIWENKTYLSLPQPQSILDALQTPQVVGPTRLLDRTIFT